MAIGADCANVDKTFDEPDNAPHCSADFSCETLGNWNDARDTDYFINTTNNPNDIFIDVDLRTKVFPVPTSQPLCDTRFLVKDCKITFNGGN